MLDFFAGLWKNVVGLRTLSSYLQWFSIALIFFSGILQLAKQVVDKREKSLTDKIVTEKDSIRTTEKSVLKKKMFALEEDLDTKEQEIIGLKKKAKYSNPYEQPIRSGSAKVTVTIQHPTKIDTHYMDQGAYIAFGKSDVPILVMTSMDSFGKSSGNDTVKYTANLTLDANDVSIGKIVNSLKETEFIQVGFAAIPKKSSVIVGKIICTINGIVRFEINIPKQQMPKDFIIAHNFVNSFKYFK